MKNLVYSCVFFDEKYLKLTKLQLISYVFFANTNINTDYLIITHKNFVEKIKSIINELNFFHKNINIFCLDLNTKHESCFSRYFIFKYAKINEYNKILYLDTDILINLDLNNLLSIELDDKIYAKQEGKTNEWAWGVSLFGNNNPNVTAFNCGVLLFPNSTKIAKIFENVINHFYYNLNNKIPIGFHDQPYINFHAIKENAYNNTKLNNLVELIGWWDPNNPKEKNIDTLDLNTIIIMHFAGGVVCEPKDKSMADYLKYVMFNLKTNNTVKNELVNKNLVIDKESIKLLNNGKLKDYDNSKYEFINNFLIKLSLNEKQFLIKFDNNYLNYIVLEKDNLNLFIGMII